MASGSLFTDADVALVQYLLKGAAVVPVSGKYGELALPDGTSRGLTIYHVSPERLKTLVPEAAVRSGELYIGGSLVMVSKTIKTAGEAELTPGAPLTFKKTDGTTVELIVAGVYDASSLPGPSANFHVLADPSLSTGRLYFV